MQVKHFQLEQEMEIFWPGKLDLKQKKSIY